MGQPTDPIVILELNLLDRTINYRNIMKTVPDQYWEDSVKPKLYPLWDTEKDRLITFRYYDNASFHCIRRKFVKNFTTNEYEWKDYEMEEDEAQEAANFYDFLKETFINIEQLLNIHQQVILIILNFKFMVRVFNLKILTTLAQHTKTVML